MCARGPAIYPHSVRDLNKPVHLHGDSDTRSQSLYSWLQANKLKKYPSCLQARVRHLAEGRNKVFPMSGWGEDCRDNGRLDGVDRNSLNTGLSWGTKVPDVRPRWLVAACCPQSGCSRGRPVERHRDICFLLVEDSVRWLNWTHKENKVGCYMFFQMFVIASMIDHRWHSAVLIAQISSKNADHEVLWLKYGIRQWSHLDKLVFICILYGELWLH